jgi:hypothetical protein
LRAGRCVERASAIFRRAREPQWQRVGAGPSGAGTQHLDLPALPSARRGYVVEYYLRGETARKSLLDLYASEAAPARVAIEPNLAPPLPWYRKWWVWTSVVAGAGAVALVTTLVLVRPPSEARLVPAN